MALEPIKTRESMSFIVKKAMGYMKDNTLFREIVTGNNNADAPFLMLSIEREEPDLAKKLYNILLIKEWLLHQHLKNLFNKQILYIFLITNQKKF